MLAASPPDCAWPKSALAGWRMSAYAVTAGAALALDNRGAIVTAGDRLPRQSICRLASVAQGRRQLVFRARIRAGSRTRETRTLFQQLSYANSAANAVLVIESGRPPPAKIVAQVAQDCRVKPKDLTIIFAPTQSLAGSTQIVARSLEVALHKMHELHFPLDRIVEGIGAAPLCPPHPDFVTAMGRTNDAIIFAGQVQLFVTGPAGEARALADKLPSRASRDYGRPFAEIFKAVSGDFYAIDPMLFSPAKVLLWRSKPAKASNPETLTWTCSMPLSPERPCCTGHASTPTVGLVVDRMDWHAREVAAALAARGFGTAPIRLHLCGIATQNASGLHIDGFGERLPDAVIVRSMSGGTFEAVTLRLGILHALRECGVMVWNDARAIERCVDKSTTSFLLARAGIRTPPTWAVESYDRARAIAQVETKEAALVLKPLFGSQGRGLRLIRKPDDLPPAEDVAGGSIICSASRGSSAADTMISACSSCGAVWSPRCKGTPCTGLPT